MNESLRVVNEVARLRTAGIVAQAIVTCEAPRHRTIILWGRPVRLYFPYVVGVAITSLTGKTLVSRSYSMRVLGSLAPIAPGATGWVLEEHPVFVMPLPHTRHSTGALCLMSPDLLNPSSPIENVWQSNFAYAENVEEMKAWVAATPEQVMSRTWWGALHDENRHYRYALFGREFPLRKALELAPSDE